MTKVLLVPETAFTIHAFCDCVLILKTCLLVQIKTPHPVLFKMLHVPPPAPVSKRRVVNTQARPAQEEGEGRVVLRAGQRGWTLRCFQA